MIKFTYLCKKVTILDHGDGLALLDQETGCLLEHVQVSKEPHYKDVWDCSYSSKLGCLCQGIGTGDKAGGIWVVATHTFYLIPYQHNAFHKHK
jgi:hypothetical protein